MQKFIMFFIIILFFTSSLYSKKVKIIYVQLGSSYCLNCKKMFPVFKKIFDKYYNKIDVRYYDITTPEGHSWVTRYGIKTVPAFIIVDYNGNSIFKHEGLLSFKDIDMIINYIITKKNK